MARRVAGKIKLNLINTENESFNEYPCYTSKNFLDENSTSSQDAQNFIDAWADVVSELSTNTLGKVDVEYTVNIDELIE